MTQPKIGYFEASNRGNNVFCFLEQHAQNFPDRSILKWVDRQTLAAWDKNLETSLAHQEVSVAQLYGLSCKLAAGFADMGITKGDRVILFVPMSLYLYASMFALQKIGAIPTFLDSWARRGQLGVSAEAVSPQAMISFEQAFQLCAGEEIFDKMPLKIVLGAHEGKYNATIEELSQSTNQVETCAMEQEETALITFTTGSSGTPKGANRTHRFLAAQHYALHRGLPYNESDVDLPVFPIFSLNNLAEGVATVIPAFDVGVPSVDDSLILMAQIKACGVTCTTLSPSLLNGLSKYCIDNQLTIPNLRRAVTGGAPVSRDNLIDFKKAAPEAKIWVLYGSTEVEPIAHIEATEMINTKSVAEDDAELVDEGVIVGHIDEGLNYKTIRINKGPITINSAADWDGVELPAGEVGELIVSGEHVCNDYYNNPEAFSRAKIKDENGIIWHRTGDLGRIDGTGNLWLVGRVHNAINRAGKYCFPVQAEIVMKKLPFTKYCAYVGIKDEKLGEKTVCVVQPNDPSQSKEDMTAEVDRIMAKNKIDTDQIIIFDDIPMDARHHSKVEYEVLRQRLNERGLA